MEEWNLTETQWSILSISGIGVETKTIKKKPKQLESQKEEVYLWK